MSDPTPSAPATEYEFTESDNQVFRDLSGTMKFVGIAGIVLGALMCVGALIELIGAKAAFVKDAIEGVAWLLIGLWTLSASGSILRIVTTQGNDIANLMSAMRELRKVYKFQMIILMVALGLVIVASVLIAVAGTMALSAR